MPVTSISICRKCGLPFDFSPAFFAAKQLSTPKTCPPCADREQNKNAEAAVENITDRQFIAECACAIIDVDLREAQRIQTGPAQTCKATLKTRPRTRGEAMARAVIYDHREDRNQCVTGSLARVQVGRVTHAGPIKRIFIHHRYRGRNEFTRPYRLPKQVEEDKGLIYLGPVEVEKEFPGSFVYIDLFPAVKILPVGRLVVRQECFLHHQTASGEPILTAEGQPIFTAVPATAAAILPGWTRLWVNEILVLYSSSIYGNITGLYAERQDTLDWYIAALEAYDELVFQLAKAGTLPPNAEQRWEKITKLRAQAAGTPYEAEALTALRQAVAALERLTGYEDAEANE